MNTRNIFLGAFSIFLLTQPLLAEGEKITKIERTSPNHTSIIIHDTTPRAEQARAEQVERARAKREQKEWRQYELETSRATVRPQPQTEDFSSVSAIRERQKYQEYQPPAFFNGGYYTGFDNNFAGFGFPGYGFYGPGAYGPGAYGPGFYGPQFQGGGYYRGYVPRGRGVSHRGGGHYRGNNGHHRGRR